MADITGARRNILAEQRRALNIGKSQEQNLHALGYTRSPGFAPTVRPRSPYAEEASRLTPVQSTPPIKADAAGGAVDTGEYVTEVGQDMVPRRRRRKVGE